MHNIQIFLDFANFYQGFIQSFSKRVDQLISMLETTKLVNISKLEIRSSNSKIVRFGVDDNNKKLVKKSRK